MIKKVVAALLLLTSTGITFAQTQPKTIPVQKFKPPKVITYLGTYKDSVAVPLAVGVELINAALRIVDAQNPAVTYAISSYQFAYKRVGVTEDEETGKVSPMRDLVADVFKITPLPAIWKKNIQETLKKGEQFYFYDVIVKDAQGRLFFAPELKILIK